MVFADPPFNLKKNYATYKDNLPLHEYLDWTYQWLEEAVRVLQPSGSLFIYNIPKLLTFSAAKLNELAIFRHWIAWNSGGRPLGKTLQPAHYGILLYSKSKDMKYYDVRAPHKRCRSCDQYLTITVARNTCAIPLAIWSAMSGTTFTAFGIRSAASKITLANCPSPYSSA